MPRHIEFPLTCIYIVLSNCKVFVGPVHELTGEDISHINWIGSGERSSCAGVPVPIRVRQWLKQKRKMLDRQAKECFKENLQGLDSQCMCRCLHPRGRGGCLHHQQMGCAPHCHLCLQLDRLSRPQRLRGEADGYLRRSE